MELGRKICFVLLSLSLHVGRTAAQDVKTMNIYQLLEFAAENSFRVKESKLNVNKSYQIQRETRSSGLPQLNGELEYRDYINLPTMILPGELAGASNNLELNFGTKHNMDVGIQVSQLLFSLEYFHGLKTAQQATKISKSLKAKTEIDLIHQIMSNYYSLLAIYKNFEIINSAIESLNETRKSVEAMLNSDLVLSTDLDRIDVNLADLKTTKNEIIAGIRMQTNNLKRLAGYDQDKEFVLDTTGVAQIFDLLEPQLIKAHGSGFEVSDRIEYQILNDKIELNEFQKKGAKSAFTPTVAIFGSYIYQAQRNQFDLFEKNKKWFNVSLIGLNAKIPIYTGSRNNSKLAQAKIEKEISINLKNEAIEGMKIEYLNALSNLDLAYSNCQTQYRNIELASKVLRQEQLKYGEGLLTLTDLLIAENNLRSTQITYVQNVIYLKNSELNLLKAKGELKKIINN